MALWITLFFFFFGGNWFSFKSEICYVCVILINLDLMGHFWHYLKKFEDIFF